MLKSSSQPKRRGRLVALPLALAATLVATFGLAGAAHAATGDPTVTVAYDASGSTSIGSINATVPISPTTLTTTVDTTAATIIDGTMPIPSQTTSFNALGFIPIRATVSLIQTSPVTGTLTPTRAGNIVAAQVAYTIKLSNVSVDVLGVWVPLFIGNNCQTINPVTINLATPSGQYFKVLTGGPLSGTFAIGNFQNCAPLDLPDIFGVGSLPINALVPGPNNTVTVNATNGTVVGTGTAP